MPMPRAFFLLVCSMNFQAWDESVLRISERWLSAVNLSSQRRISIFLIHVMPKYASDDRRGDF